MFEGTGGEFDMVEEDMRLQQLQDCPITADLQSSFREKRSLKQRRHIRN
jgi:hypothetical protein